MHMTEVTDVLALRRQRPDKFGRMIVWSAAVHTAAVGLLLFGPFDWDVVADAPPPTVMTISLAGAPGPRAGGMTPMGGRVVPAPTPAPTRAMPPPPPIG